MPSAASLIEKRRQLWEQHHDIAQDKEFTDSIAEFLTRDAEKNPESEALRLELKKDTDLLIELCFVVVDKDKNTVPFFLNEVQRDFSMRIKKAQEDFLAGRRHHLKFLVLKGRQQGLTSYITAHQLAEAISQKNWAGYTLADNAENTETIFTDKSKYPYDNLPFELKPVEKYNTRRELHFDNLNSRWRIATAGANDVGRSKTLNAFHGSEAAFWKRLMEILAGVEEALTKGALEILESTANGPNEFKQLCTDAQQGKNNWELVFYEWWRTPEYRLNFESPEKEIEFLAKIAAGKDDPLVPMREKDCFEEIRWLQKKGLDMAQLYWYYNKWRDNHLIKQEYPNTVEQAFKAGEGIAFPEFSYDIHVCPDFTPPEHWKRWRGLDNGYSDPYSWHWFTVSEDGQVIIYREYTREPDEPKVVYSDQARKAKELSTYIDETGAEYQEKISYTVAGLDAWDTHVRDTQGKTLIDYYLEGGVTGFIPAITDRRLRKAVWHEYLNPYYDENLKRWTAKVQICQSCKKLIETLPQLMKDEKDSEKVAECSIDHWYDGAGYGLIAYHNKQSRPIPEEESKIKRDKERLAKQFINKARRRVQ